jgi:hypothetical protein
VLPALEAHGIERAGGGGVARGGRLPPVQHIDYDLPTQQEYLARVASLPYQDAKILLEKKLEQEPTNAEVRRLYLELAEANSDHAEITRHSSVLNIDSFDVFAFVKFLLVLLLAIALIWQAYRLYNDFRHS